MPSPVIYEVCAADVYGASADSTPQPLPPERVWWISVAARVFPALATTSKAKRERKAGRLTLNGDAAIRTNTPVVVGDRIAYEPPESIHAGATGDGGASAQPPEEQRKQSPEQWCEICRRQGLRVAFDSTAFAVVVKPVGVHVKGRGWRTVENALPALLRPSPAAHPDSVLPTAHAVHRLDYRVGGLLLVAKTRTAEVALSRQFESHRVLKRYRAILVGRLDPSRLTPDGLSPSPPPDFSTTLGPPHSTSPIYYVSTPIDGKPSCTALVVRSVSPSARYEWLTTVDLWPLTGRCHQLRVHMASLGHPIVGDDLHHNHQLTQDAVSVDTEVVRGAGLFLHAVAISFEDQRGNRRSFEIDEPHKFSRFRHFCALNRDKQSHKAKHKPPPANGTRD